MKILVMGATGVLARAAVPMLVAEGHEVTGTTRSNDKFELVERLGARPVVADVYDAASLDAAFEAARPEVVINLLTDLAGFDYASNSRIRTEGAASLTQAAQRAGVTRMIAESISWVTVPGVSPSTEADPLNLDAPPPTGPMVKAVQALEDATAELPHGTVLRFGMLYGPHTWYSADGMLGQAARDSKLAATPTVSCFVHVDDAGRAILQALGWAPGVFNIVDDEPAPGTVWTPAFCHALDAPPPAVENSDDPGRPVSNAKARGAGWVPQLPSWRQGFQTL